MTMIMEIIQKKRDGYELTNEEITDFVRSVTDGSIEECQIGAILMAIYIRKLTERETVYLTKAMSISGNVLNWDQTWNDLLVDKHSTGGVGDKISLILAPTLAAIGFKVPMVSGRGLGFTGGTLDKLESIPGFKVNCSSEDMKMCLEEAGCFIAGSTESFVPADKVLYKVRDVTATVFNNSLIISSIISKKVAEGTKALVLDMKVGKAGSCKTVQEARNLGKQLMDVARDLGILTRVVISRMDSPIGRTVGNSLEVAEAIECLQGKIPLDVLELVSTLGSVLLQIKSRVSSFENGKEIITEIIKSGKALTTFQKMLICQGVSESKANEICYGNVWEVLPKVPQNHITHILSPGLGKIADIDGKQVAIVSWKLGSGRSNINDNIDYRVGVKILKTIGEEVNTDDPVLEVHHGSEQLDPQMAQQLTEAIKVSPPGQHIDMLSPVIEIM